MSMETNEEEEYDKCESVKAALHVAAESLKVAYNLLDKV